MPVVTLAKPENFSLPNLSTPVVARPSKIRVKAVMADYETVKSMIAPLQLGSIREYKEYIETNNLTDIFPKNPMVFYSKDWNGAKDFLSMSQERIDARNIERSKKAVAVKLKNIEARKAEKALQVKEEIKVAPVVAPVLTDAPEAVKTISQLIDLGVPVNLVESVFKSMDLSVSQLKECVIYLLNK